MLLLLCLVPFASSFSLPRSQPSPSALSLHASTINLGVFGGGVVGGGIIEILESRKEHFREITGGCDLVVKKICVKNKDKKRDYSVPASAEIVTSYDAILSDPSISLVVEVMGGKTDAKDVVFASLKAHKNVVTANKALIADSLPEIDALLKDINQGQDDKVEFKYEAAVCGGIPIINSLQSDFVGDEISVVNGIINGCTNFMLTAMDRDKMSYTDALSKAGDLGYAEADPTLDVGGFDARSKLKILIRLAFGLDVTEEEIACKGIQDLTKTDFEYARMLGGTIKLMGSAKRISSDSIAAFVSPVYVNDFDTLASVSGATNAVEICSKNLVQSTYTGQGAGRFPTANSCVNDILKIAKGDKNALPFNTLDPSVKFVNDFSSRFYIRLKYRDALGITKEVGEICERHGIGIHSMLQNPVLDKNDAAFAITTGSVPFSAIKRFVADVEGLEWCFGDAFFMPILRD